MRFTLGSGYHATKANAEFFGQWHHNNTMADTAPERVIVVSAGNDARPVFDHIGPVNLLPQVVNLSGNPGHVGDLLNGTKPHELCGWSGAVIALAMIAYCNETDFIYKEQDCLAFGPWVDQMYKDIGTKGMVFGRKMVNAPYMPCAQSLFLVRHHFIPEFVRRYLELGPENNPHNLPEHKFARLEELWPQHYARLSFGYDRERPINFDDPVFYAQKLTAPEMEELRRRNLI